MKEGRVSSVRLERLESIIKVVYAWGDNDAHHVKVKWKCESRRWYQPIKGSSAAEARLSAPSAAEFIP
jgi:hypothetical protein